MLGVAALPGVLPADRWVPARPFELWSLGFRVVPR
jgi:hypothetical protein